MLYKHLFFSVYKIRDDQLLDRLFSLTELHHDWSGLFKKSQANLNNEFLEVSSLNLKSWVEDLVGCFPDIVKLIENSAKKTEETMVTVQGGLIC